MYMITNTRNPPPAGLYGSNITGLMCNHCGQMALRSHKTMKLDKESQTDCSLFDLLYFSFNFDFSKGTQTDINSQEI